MVSPWEPKWSQNIFFIDFGVALGVTLETTFRVFSRKSELGPLFVGVRCQCVFSESFLCRDCGWWDGQHANSVRPPRPLLASRFVIGKTCPNMFFACAMLQTSSFGGQYTGKFTVLIDGDWCEKICYVSAHLVPKWTPQGSIMHQVR